MGGKSSLRGIWEDAMAMRRKATLRAIVTVLVLSLATMGVPLLGAKANAKMQKQAFGKLKDGQTVDLYVLTNGHGMEAAVTNYGATLVWLKVPGRDGKTGDVVLGYDNLQGYEEGKASFGGTVGRYANRIAHAKFTLDGTTYTLEKNDGDNHLHGGFNKRIWTAKDVSSNAGLALELTYLSKDGEEGYPGNLSVKVVYTLLAGRNELKIDYTATTDKATVLNLTNHSYFNLAGQGNGDVLQQQLTIHAGKFTPVDAALIPTGELRDVRGTPLDFLQATAIGARINQDDPQLKLGKGYDYNYVLDRGAAGGLTAAAEAYDPQSGRVLQISTTEPGVQFYSGNFLEGTTGKGGEAYHNRFAFCLETQHFPDSPNHPDFPSTVLRPGQEFRSTTSYTFSTR
jgi:aldose 1-epimerase